MSGPWTKLFEQVEAERAGDYRGLESELRSALAPLGKKGLAEHDCWVSAQRSTLGVEVKANRGDAISLSSLPVGVHAAELRVLCEINNDRRHLLALDLLIEGLRDDETPFRIAVHLPRHRAHGGPDGAGPCSHPALHCHVGPDHRSAPQVRVPLPPMRPGALLSWLLCQVYTDLEPEPWPAR